MIGTGMIRHLVQNDLDALRVRPVYQFTELVEIAEVLVNSVEIDRAVAVVVRAGLAVFRAG